MRISDWRSEVWSSALLLLGLGNLSFRRFHLFRLLPLGLEDLSARLDPEGLALPVHLGDRLLQYLPDCPFLLGCPVLLVGLALRVHLGGLVLHCHHQFVTAPRRERGYMVVSISL